MAENHFLAAARQDGHLEMPRHRNAGVVRYFSENLPTNCSEAVPGPGTAWKCRDTGTRVSRYIFL